MTGVPLSVLDELYLHLDRDTEPWSVQLEAQVEGHLDPDRDGSRFVDTTVLSNLGRHEPVPALDADAGRVRRVWFSPPGRMPLGASLGAATYGDRLFLSLRYRHALFDASAAAAFAGSLRDLLTTT